MTASETGPTDAHLVSLVLAADRDAFAVVYDRYGPRLYDFAYSMLRHPEDAADAVADSFVLFAERLPQLREPDRLRPWLYAIVRSECLRRLKARKRVSYGDDEQLISMADDAKTPEEEAETAALRQLVWDAAAGLADRDRALLDLHLRQGLEGAELGEAMGVTAANAYVMVNRLKAQVDKSLGALLIARLGRDECEELDDLLVDWDGSYSPLIRKRVARHIENCEICGERRKKMVSPWMLFAAVPVFTAPAALRDRVLNDTQLVAYSSPGAASGGSNAAPAAGSSILPASRRARILTAAAALLAIAVVGTVLFWPSDAGTPPTSPVATGPATTVPTGGQTLTASPSAQPTPTATTTTSPSPSESPSVAPGTLTVSTGAIDLGVSTGTKSFTVTNTGGAPVSFQAAAGRSWMTVSPASAIVQPGDSRSIAVGARRAGLPEGTSTGDLRITWPDGSATVRVSVRQENPPAVGRPEFGSSSTCTSNPVTVTVTDESAISSVRLTWSGPTGTHTAAMTRIAGTNRWRYDMGEFSPGGDVTARVTATDGRGNRATGPAGTQFVLPCPG